MAVYTILHHSEIQELLSHFDLPALTSFEGASSGIENSTYFLTLASGTQYVLTVFEQFSTETIAPYVRLTSHFNQLGLPVPCPCLDSAGKTLQTIAGKPALLFPRAQGRHIKFVDVNACSEVGSTLARIHQANPVSLSIANPCGLDWMKETFSFVKDSLDQADQILLQEQISLSTELELRQLPKGIIHGDLFRDNVLYDGGHISAVIDFYNAGQDIFLLDLAIVANDWCYSEPGNNPGDNINALAHAYRQVRHLNEEELSCWNHCLRVAAARFWLSRLKRVVLASAGGTHTTKDPMEYKNLLLFHIREPKLLSQ